MRSVASSKMEDALAALVAELAAAVAALSNSLIERLGHHFSVLWVRRKWLVHGTASPVATRPPTGPQPPAQLNICMPHRLASPGHPCSCRCITSLQPLTCCSAF